ncbi:hypothetical protein BBJ28_00016554 [Nothophytophthora sp. Chile5]|nr:hypothetical protein BBJ28_00016554 [Nothophytophthora sp. Chile5]
MPSAFAYLYDRSVGLPSRSFRDALHASQARELALPPPATRSFIYRRGMRVWSLALEPLAERFLLVGTSQSQLLLFDLQQLDDADADSTLRYDTNRPLDPVSAASARVAGSDGLQFGVSSVDWYPVDGGLCISGSLDGHVKVWDAETLECVTTLSLRSKVFCAKFSPVSTTHALIAAATAKGEVRLVDMASGATAHSLLGHRDEIWSLAWAPSSEFQLVSGARDGEVRLWDIRRSGATACLLCLNHEGAASVPGRSSLYTNVKRQKATTLAAAAVSRKRRRVSGSGASEAQARDQARAHARVESHTERLAAGERNQKRNDPHAAAATSLAIAHHGGVTSLAYTPDGRFLLSSGSDEKLRLWDAHSGAHQFMNYQGVQRAQPRATRCLQMAVVQEAGAWESTLVFVPNGPQGQLASFRVFGDSGAPLAQATAHYEQITACVYRKTQRELFSAGEDGLIMKWKPPSVDLYPEDPEAMNGEGHGQTGSVNVIAGAAEGDRDAWSDEDEEAENGEDAGGSAGLLSATDFFGKGDAGGVEKFKTVAFRALHEQKLEEELQQTKQENERLRDAHARVSQDFQELQMSFEANIEDRERVLAFKSKRIEELHSKLRECEAINNSLLQTINVSGTGAANSGEAGAARGNNGSTGGGGGDVNVTGTETRAKMMMLLNAGKPLFHALDKCKEQEYKQRYEETQQRYTQLLQISRENDAVVRETRLAQSEKQDSDAHIKHLEAQLAAVALEKEDLTHHLERKLILENDRLRREKETELQAYQDVMRTQMRMQLDVTTQRTVEENERMQLELRYQSSHLEKLMKQVDHLRAENKRAQQEMHVFEDMNAGLSKKLKFYEQLFAKMQRKDEQRAKQIENNQQAQTASAASSPPSTRRMPRKPPLPSLTSPRSREAASPGVASILIDTSPPPSCFAPYSDLEDDSLLRYLDNDGDEVPQGQQQLNSVTDVLEKHLQSREFAKKQVAAILQYHQDQYRRRQMPKIGRESSRLAATPVRKKKLMLSKACYSPASYQRGHRIREPPMTLDALIKQKAALPSPSPLPPSPALNNSTDQPADDYLEQRQIVHALLPEIPSRRKTSSQRPPLTARDPSEIWKASTPRQLDGVGSETPISSPPATARF